MKPRIFTVDQHNIDQSRLDSDAIRVIAKLKEAGHTAYLVGGGVRDLLFQNTPKDFDISTSAKPEEIKQIFGRQCLIIGRRFRLAHIRFGHKIFEVSTFRTGESEDDLIVTDNEWGSPEEDVLRRDFTINGLFYDPAEQVVIDYVLGWEDIQKKILRTIGEPAVRFKQDPVRMIRLLKFRARFGFEIEENARKALLLCRAEINKSSPARVLEEILKMIESSASAPFFHLLSESGLLKRLMPSLSNFLQGQHGLEVYKLLDAADKLQKVPYLSDRSVLITSLLFPILEEEIRLQYLNQGVSPHIGDVMNLSSSIVHAVLVSSFRHFPRKISSTVNFILSTQYRLTPLSGRRHPRPKLMRNKEFALAMAFLKIRSEVSPHLKEDYHHWKNLLKQLDRRPHSHAHH